MPPHGAHLSFHRCAGRPMALEYSSRCPVARNLAPPPSTKLSCAKSCRSFPTALQKSLNPRYLHRVPDGPEGSYYLLRSVFGVLFPDCGGANPRSSATIAWPPLALLRRATLSRKPRRKSNARTAPVRWSVLLGVPPALYVRKLLTHRETLAKRPAITHCSLLQEIAVDIRAGRCIAASSR
jgi:hypothetical protein